MRNLMLVFTACIIYPLPVDLTCSLPFTGTWVTSNRGTWVVSSNSIQNFKMIVDVSGSTLWTMDCYSFDGTYYVLKSNGIYRPFTTVDTYIYICMSFTMQSYFKYLFSIHTSEHEVKTSPSVYERVIIKHISVTSVSQGEVCNDISNLGMERYHVAVKQGHAVSAMVTCPTSIQGIFSYTYTGLACTDTLLDTCTNKTMFIYNDTLCNDNPMFSSEGTLHCAFTGIEGSDTFVTLYNADSSVTNPTSFQFSCMVYTTSGSTVSATINPEECITGQTSTSLSSTYGKTVTYTALSSCSTPEPEESEDDFTWLYILLAVFVLLVLILVIFVLIKSSFKKKEQVLPNKTEDVIISKPPIRHIFT